MITTQANPKDHGSYRMRRRSSALFLTLVLSAWTPRLLAECDCEIRVATGEWTIIYEDTTADCVCVDAGGRLDIAAGVTLTLIGSNGGPASKIDGELRLRGSGSQIRILSRNHAFTGDGRILGENGSARIAIGDGLTLTNQITIEGMLRIVGLPGGNTTRFINDAGGLVHANDAGVLDLNVDALDDGTNCSAGDWKVSSANAALLKFSVGSTKLSGDFTVDVSHASGKLWIRDNVATEGDLIFSDGTIVVDSGCHFKANWDCGCP